MLDALKTYRTANGEFSGIKINPKRIEIMDGETYARRTNDGAASDPHYWRLSDGARGAFHGGSKWDLVAEDESAAKVDVTKIRPGDQVTITGRVIQVDSVEPRIAVRWQEDRTNWLDTRYLEIASHVPGPAYEPKLGDKVTWGGGAVDYYVAGIDGDTVSLASAPPCLTKKISDLRQVLA